MNTDRYTQLFQKMPIPRFIVESKGENSYVVSAANDFALRYFDLDAAHVIGHDIRNFMGADNSRHFQQSFEVCLARKKSATIQALPGMPGKLRVYGFYISPVMNAAHEVEFLDVIGQIDIADQSILQRERDDAISLMTSIFDVSEVGVVVTDHNGLIIRVNESFVRTYGWSRGEIVNGDVADLVPPDERVAVRRNHQEAIRNGRRNSGELKIIRKDGGIANVLFTTATLELSQRRRFQVTTFMDITLRKQMEESLRHAKDQADTANHAKSAFLANMSHELRTPLNAIIGFSEMMIKETFGPLGHMKYREYLGDVHASARHLLEIINEVLDMSKIEAGRIELDESEFDLRELIASVTRMMASRAFGNNVKLDMDISDGLPSLFADQRLVRQILINIVTNAVKFSNHGGRIVIGAHPKEDGGVYIEIADDGIGIPKNKINRAMEPFGQVSDRPDKAQQQGTGLGLPLARAMAELHDGSLTLKSEQGVGTTVSIAFPAYRAIPASTGLAR